jgi:hypothetical protein
MSEANSAASPQFRQFLDNLGYAHGLITAGIALGAVVGTNLGDLSAVDPSDMYRAAWTQTIAALDHWVHEEIYVRATRLVRDHTAQRPDHLQRFPIQLERIEDVLRERVAMDDMFLQTLRETIGRASLQQPDDIMDELRLIVVKRPYEIWTEVASSINARRGVTIWNPTSVKGRQKAVVWRRNRIAHEADLDHGARRPITAQEASGTVRLDQRPWLRAPQIARLV